MTSDTPEPGWSGPDSAGICTRMVDIGAKSTLRGKRRRRSFTQQPQVVNLWSEEWRILLRQWLQGRTVKKRWSTLLKTAGSNRVREATELLQALLQTGWIEVEEQRRPGRWEITQVELLALETLREQLGLKNRHKVQAEWQRLGEILFAEPQLEQLRRKLFELPSETAIKRHELLQALADWHEQEYFGTRRDFALFARGTTKAISGSEWRWLAESLALEKWRIDQHTPILYLHAPLRLRFAEAELDLRAIPDFIALTPETIDALLSIDGQLRHWLVVENQTCFERLARHSEPGEAVLWVPGYPPSWWQTAVAQLVALCPAAARVACDPDPAGIRIALQVGQIWEQNGKPWTPWKMGAAELAALKHSRPITDNDQSLLAGLLKQPLPPIFLALANAMLQYGIKGEQEELF